jgi:hypothetical protein
VARPPQRAYRRHCTGRVATAAAVLIRLRYVDHAFARWPTGAPPSGGFCFEPGQTTLESIADPGTALSGAVLKDVQTIVDSGVLVGTGYGVQPTTQTWSVRTDAKTKAGNYQFWCSVHDFMNGTLAVGQ